MGRREPGEVQSRGRRLGGRRKVLSSYGRIKGRPDGEYTRFFFFFFPSE